ncbi:hypothetical protein BLD44_006085 [Mastigocladus laminosus UU774]|nr:hypothetical protein BLD44_006085 [Mastigocladus laminosus UU774]
MGKGDSPEETLRVDASAASHRVRGLGIGERVKGRSGGQGGQGRTFVVFSPAPRSPIPDP